MLNCMTHRCVDSNCIILYWRFLFQVQIIKNIAIPLFLVRAICCMPCTAEDKQSVIFIVHYLWKTTLVINSILIGIFLSVKRKDLDDLFCNVISCGGDEEIVNPLK